MMTTTLDDEEDLDPRIQVELDHLNQYSGEINRLENEIDEAQAQYRAMFTESSKNMEQMGRKIKKRIQRARQYYEIKEAAVVAQSEVLRSARQFQTAIGVYRAAKETIALAELKLIDSQGNQSSAAMLSTAWQEMLNHAYIRVMEAEKEKSLSEQEHLKRSQVFVELESKLQTLEKKFKSSIAKARPYFEMKAKCELKLKQQKQNVSDLQQAITSTKRKYADALSRLEKISEEIHESRRQTILLMFPREPGVGADSDSLCSSITESGIEKGLFPSLTKSASGDDVSHNTDSCSVTSDQDEDAVFHVTENTPDPCACPAIDTDNSKSGTTTRNNVSWVQSSKDSTDTVSLGMRSSGSGSSVQEKVPTDLLADPVADDSTSISSASVTDDTNHCVDPDVRASSPAETSTDTENNEHGEVPLSEGREPGNSSDTKQISEDTVSTRLESSESAIIVQEKESEDSEIRPVTDVTTSASITKDSAPSMCTPSIVVTNTDEQNDVPSEVSLSQKREPGSGSESQPVCTETCDESALTAKIEITEEQNLDIVVKECETETGPAFQSSEHVCS
ncbi:SH3 domain-binding protein 5-like [Gigantopelta aegis]|uniref:SH3 domain-binding protein 5-like n=1 Tax=Gigantopelta aegis TaxID=1735272 RepID=UPI001B88E510|nr:SH3 domain-binding protein 5-like [Gigantopelta aegis]